MEAPRPWQGIRVQLLVPILAVTTAVIVIAGLFQQQQELERLRAGRDAEVEASVARLSRILPAALTDLDHELIRNALQGELSGAHIGSVAVDLNGRELVAVDRPHLTEDDWLTKRLERHYDLAGGDRATVRLATDATVLRETMVASLWRIGASVVFIDLLVAVAVWWIVTQVTAPIVRLTTTARAMAEGRLDAPFEVRARGEVGELARAFERMRTAIRMTIGTIEAQNRDLDARVQDRSHQLEQAQTELLEAANLAGKAELATGVLHNIGNVLTGIFIDLELLRLTSPGDLQRTCQALQERYAQFPSSEALIEHLRREPSSAQLPHLTALVLDEILRAEATRLDLLRRLEEHLTMVRDIVALQQAHATGRHFVQAIDLQRVTEDMVLLHANGFRQRGIAVHTRFTDLPPVQGDRVKLAHVLANLLRNAQDALAGAQDSDRRLVITTARVQDPPGLAPGAYGEIRVRDNGCGIAPDVRDRIFTHGFTTKRHGHGFGLHACANAMHEMAGSIRLHSDGAGQGTTAIVCLPLDLESGRNAGTVLE